jgi:hypothetical protein
VDRLSLGHVFLPVLRVSPCHHHSTDASCCSIYHRHCVNLAIDSVIFFSPCGVSTRFGVKVSHFGASWSHLNARYTVGLLLDEWSARRRDLYLTTHNSRNRHTSMPPAGFEPAIPASERPQIHALNRATLG